MTDHTSIMAAARSVMCICWWVTSCTTPFMFLSAQVNTMLAWLLKMGRLKRCSASSRKRGSLTFLMSERASRMGMLMRSFSLLMSMRRAPAASAAAPMPLTSSTCMESQPMAAASATMTSLGLAFMTSLITAATNSGLVLTEVVGRRRMAGVGLEHHRAAGLDEVLHASQEGEDLGHHLLGIVPFGDGYDRLGHVCTSVLLGADPGQQPGEHVGRSFQCHLGVETFQVAQVLPPDPGEQLGHDEVGLDVGADGALGLALLHEVGVPAEHLHPAPHHVVVDPVLGDPGDELEHGGVEPLDVFGEDGGVGVAHLAQPVHDARGLRGVEPGEHPVDEHVVRRDEDVLPAVEVPVERGVGDAHRLGDARHAGAGQAVLGHQPQGLLHDLRPPLGRPGGGRRPGLSRRGDRRRRAAASRVSGAGFTRPR